MVTHVNYVEELLASVGATISFSVGKYHVRFSSRFLKADVKLIIELLAEQLRDPIFNPQDLETLKKREIGKLEQAKQNTDTRCDIAFLQSLYPKDHPNCSLELEDQIEFVRAITVEDLKSFHSEFYGKGSITIVAVGDVEPEKLAEKIKRDLGDWKEAPIKSIPVTSLKANPPKQESKKINILDKTSCNVHFGCPVGIDRNHSDFLSLMVASYVLGGNFSARLMSTVRDKEGLTYGIYSFLGGVDWMLDGYFTVSGTFAPSLLEKGQQSTLHQVPSNHAIFQNIDLRLK